MTLPDDPIILEMLPEFIDTWLADIDEQYDNYLEEKNSKDLYRLAHTLKGSCYQFNINEIGDMGVELMGYCKEENWDKCKEMKEPIVNKFQEAKKFVEDNIGS